MHTFSEKLQTIHTAHTDQILSTSLRFVCLKDKYSAILVYFMLSSGDEIS